MSIENQVFALLVLRDRIALDALAARAVESRYADNGSLSSALAARAYEVSCAIRDTIERSGLTRLQIERVYAEHALRACDQQRAEKQALDARADKRALARVMRNRASVRTVKRDPVRAFSKALRSAMSSGKCATEAYINDCLDSALANCSQR